MTHNTRWSQFAAWPLAVAMTAVIIVALCAKTPATSADSPAVTPDERLPKLAVTVSAEKLDAKNLADMEDLLIVELGNQRFLQLVDRKNLQTILKEHAFVLNNLNDAKNAAALGKFAQADYLLHVSVVGEKASIRLVEVATAQVKLETQIKLGTDLSLFSASVREKVLAAIQSQSQAAQRLTVGIAAFPNRSGMDRSDKLSVELQKLLRNRLEGQTWAVVLERQYPTALLNEVNLARTGLANGDAAETLPPADLVLSGTIQDADNEYVAGRPWTVQLDLTLRLHRQEIQLRQVCRSDAIEAAVDAIMQKIDDFRRRQPAAASAMPEKELWRRQAMYLMPRSPYAVGRQPHPCSTKREKLDTIELIRDWENVLLLDADDVEAQLNLGMCLISLYNGNRARMAVEQCLRGSRLVETAVRILPNHHNAASFLLRGAKSERVFAQSQRGNV
jgi:hypothetical protein